MKVFRSKVNFIFLGLFLVLFVIFILKIVFDQTIDTLGGWFLKLFIGLLLAFCIDLFLRTRYIIKETTLYIKSGLLNYPAIPIKSIKSIEKTNSIIAAPAASMDRIEIKFNTYDSVIISPINKKAFITALQTVNPSIKSTI
ncbi:hypothetical protein ULMS_03990 [Patiriisocius marinistellae]|uniref:Uncharacterized protein YyaB-like PH domain-containing protein n=1 Tax=Patiriisocius marinistellae TaxID=2494560 RepID=A0A5J4FYY1_9FLAO|nr:PH domain-containing protein [Patiriisocius marinistellae]GEQ84891.1 hypothetical protein ULMS_03990 [Patiriisocius marinistellae]